MKKYVEANLRDLPEGEYTLTVVEDEAGNTELFINLPETKKAEWLDIAGHSVCSNCHFYCTDDYELGQGNYCPECGSKMKNPFYSVDSKCSRKWEVESDGKKA